VKLEDLSKKLNASLIGNPDQEIVGLSSILSPKMNSITVITSRALYSDSIVKNSAAILIDKSILSLNILPDHVNALVVDDSFLALVEVGKIFGQAESTLIKHDKKNPLNKKYIGKNVKIGKNFSYGLNVVIEDNVTLGDNVFLDHNVVIKRNSIIGNNVIIGSNSIIGSEGFGNYKDQNGDWVHIPHIGKVKIGNNVSIGANCSIDRGTIDSTEISNGVIIDNLVHVAHNVVIGEKTAIAAKVGIAGSCIIGKRNMIGGMVGIVDHVRTADDITISATSTVINDLKEPGVYTGIMPISKHATWKRIALWITKLDKIAKSINFKKL